MSIEETAKDLVEALKGKPVPAPYDTSATVVRVEDDTLWVHIPGGVEETPVRKTVSASAGDEIQIRVGGGRAWAVGNATAPPTDDTKANAAMGEANDAREEIKDLEVQITKLFADWAHIGEAIIDTLTTNDITAKNLTVIDDDGNVVGTFRDSIIIGDEDKTHMEIDFNSLELYDKNGTLYTSIGDNRDADGIANVVETFTGDGTTTRFTLQYLPSVINSITVNGTETTAYTRSGYIITFTTAPAEKALVEVDYDTNSAMYHFDLGIRSGETGPFSFVAGDRNKATDVYTSVAGGYNNEATGFASHVGGGRGNKVTGPLSVISGGDANTAKGGDAAVAGGNGNSAYGDFSFVGGGIGNAAQGQSSSAFGGYTRATHHYQHVFGVYNELDPSTAPFTNKGTYIEIVGNGSSSSARSNARTLDWQGNEVLAGGLTINGSTDVGAILAALTADTGWVDLNPVFYRKVGTTVFVSCHAQYSSALASRTWKTIATLPAGFRPSRRYDAAVAFGYNAEIPGAVRIGSDGKVDVYPSAAVSSPYIAFSVAYPV